MWVRSPSSARRPDAQSVAAGAQFRAPTAAERGDLVPQDEELDVLVEDARLISKSSPSACWKIR